MTKSLRVLLVATEVDIGGREGGATHVRELLRGFRARGPTLLLGREGYDGEGVVGIGRAADRFPPRHPHRWAIRALPSAVRHAFGFRPDVIYERCTSYGLGAALGAVLRCPVVTTVLDQRLSPVSSRLADMLVATDLRLIPSAHRHKAHRVQWGVNETLFAPRPMLEARRKLGLPQGVPIVTYVGSFKAWHDLATLLRAARRMESSGVHFVLVGDGPLRMPAIGLARRFGIRDRFVLPGSVPYEHVPDWMAAADVCVAPFDPSMHPPSRRLGFSLDPLKVFEALAMEKPTVTVDAPNLRRMFEPERHLRLVAPRDPDALAAALVRCIEEPHESALLAQEGRRRVLERYTWRRHVAHLERLFMGFARG